MTAWLHGAEALKELTSKKEEKKTKEDLSHTPSPWYKKARELKHRLADGSLKSSVDEEWERTH
jgi:hypothetical protein